MSWIGDFAAESTFDTKFCTVTTTGAPTQLAGTPVVSAYEDNGTTQITAGITLTVDFDGVTGLNNVRVVATAANGYDAGSNYQLVITTGTVGGTSVVGYVVAEFSLEARSALRPTTAGRTLDVSAGGEAGLDWANVGSPTTTVGLSGTTVKTATDVETKVDTVDTNVDAILVDTGTTLQAELDAIEAAVITNAAGVDIAADIIALKAETAAILVDTGTTLDAALAVVDGNVDAILVDTGTTLQAELDGIQADTEDIQARLPAALSAAGNMKSDVKEVNDVTLQGVGTSGDPWKPA